MIALDVAHGFQLLDDRLELLRRLRNAATAFCRAVMCSRSHSGVRSHCRSSRPPMLVRVRSMALSSEPSVRRCGTVRSTSRLRQLAGSIADEIIDDMPVAAGANAKGPSSAVSPRYVSNAAIAKSPDHRRRIQTRRRFYAYCLRSSSIAWCGRELPTRADREHARSELFDPAGDVVGLAARQFRHEDLRRPQAGDFVEHLAVDAAHRGDRAGR